MESFAEMLMKSADAFLCPISSLSQVIQVSVFALFLCLNMVVDLKHANLLKLYPGKTLASNPVPGIEK